VLSSYPLVPVVLVDGLTWAALAAIATLIPTTATAPVTTAAAVAIEAFRARSPGAPAARVVLGPSRVLPFRKASVSSVNL
jgi:hypothetical protein